MIDCMNHLAALGYRDETLLMRLGGDNPLRALGLDATDVDIPNGPAVAWTGAAFRMRNPE
jgi:hypothetical protein